MKNQNYLFREAENEVIRLLKSFPTVAIVGPRQVGKTTLVKKIVEKLPKTAVYLDLEFPQDLAALQNPIAFFERNADKTIIIDEVQRAPALFPILRAVIDRQREPARFILLGSASPEIIQKSSETLAGRIAFVELRPFSFAEISDRFSLETHWFRGGFPESLIAEDDAAAVDWRKNFIQTYLERDLPMLGLRADSLLLGRLWTMLAHLNANLLNKSTLTNSLGIHMATLQRYVDFFESAFLIRTLQPFVPLATKRLVKSPKIFLRDTGILHQLLSIRSYEGLLGHPAVGASWESYVFNQLFFHLPDGHELFFYRTQDGTEADFVVTEGGAPKVLVEAKFSSSPSVSKGFFIARDDLKTIKNVVISPVSMAFPLKNGIEAVPISEIGSIF